MRRSILRRLIPVLAGALAAGCVVYDTGPTDPDGRFPRVEGTWRIDARALHSTCGIVDDEPFTVQVHQNRGLLQIVLRITGFGDVRYDGRLEPDGEFSVSQRTVFPRESIRDESRVDGRFSRTGRSLTATEQEWIVDLVTGRTCSVTWRWRGDRRW